jgi:hypothetical protein
MEIPMMKPRILQVSLKKGIGHQCLLFNDKVLHGMRRDHHRYPDPIDDHLPEKSHGNVWSIPEPQDNIFKGAMMLRCIWNCQSVDRKKSEKFHRDPKVIRSVLEGVSEQRKLNIINGINMKYN